MLSSASSPEATMQLGEGGVATEPAAAAARRNSSSSVFTIDKTAQSLINEVNQKKSKESLIQLAVDPDTCVISLKNSVAFDGCSRRERMQRLLKLAKELGGPSLFIFRVDLRSNSPEWALLAYAPKDSVSYAERIFCFTALSWLSGAFVDAQRNPMREYFVTEEAELPTFKWT